MRFLGISVAFILLLPAFSCGGQEESLQDLSDRVFSLAESQARILERQLTDRTVPRTLDAPEGTLVTAPINWWTSGFFAGSLWQIYAHSHDEGIASRAEVQTRKMSHLLERHTDHDIGFQLMCSYGNAFRLTGDASYLPVLKAGAERFAGRFSPVTGTTRSWDSRPEKGWDWPVIIDNLMNLELLTFASVRFGVPEWKEMAVSHARTTARNHFRSDYSTWHLVDYDRNSGAVRSKGTHQGYSDDSMWARGEAWALYGYTMMARETGMEEFRIQAVHIAELLFARLPEDGIPYWDFDCSDYKDASAAAIMASGFLQLYGLTGEEAFRSMAQRQIRTLAGPEYLAEPGTNGGFLLKHCVENLPGGSEIEVPLSYADYYFLEALNLLIP